MYGIMHLDVLKLRLYQPGQACTVPPGLLRDFAFTTQTSGNTSTPVLDLALTTSLRIMVLNANLRKLVIKGKALPRPFKRNSKEWFLPARQNEVFFTENAGQKK